MKQARFFNFQVGYRNKQTVYCLIADDPARLRQTIQLMYGKTPNLAKIRRGKVFAACFRYPEQPPLIWLPRQPRNKQEYGSLAHEAVHATTAILLNRYFTEELLARTVGHIVYQILVRE